MNKGKWTGLGWKLSGTNGNSDTHVHPDISCNKCVLMYFFPARTLKARRKCCILLLKIAAFACIKPSPGNHTVHFSLHHQNVQIPKSRGNLQEPEDPEAGSAAALSIHPKFCLSRQQKNEETAHFWWNRIKKEKENVHFEWQGWSLLVLYEGNGLTTSHIRVCVEHLGHLHAGGLPCSLL